MIAIILAVLAGCVPSLLLFFWFRNRLNKGNELYKKNCDRMLVSGLLTVFPVFLISACITIIINLSGVKTSHPLLYAGLHTFLVFALSEEVSKFYMFWRKLKKIEGAHSWIDLTIYSTIVGIGFGLLESIVYVLDTNPAVMLVRGISIPHGGYAAIVGYFFAKSIKENKKGYTVLGFLIAFLMHGLYDFSLSEEFLNATDVAALIAVILAVMDVVIIIVLIVFICKHKNDPKYTEPLIHNPIQTDEAVAQNAADKPDELGVSEKFKAVIQKAGATGVGVLNHEIDAEMYRGDLLEVLAAMKSASESDIKAAGYPANIQNTLLMDRNLIEDTVTEEIDQLSLLNTVVTYIECNAEGMPEHSKVYMDRVTDLRKALESVYDTEAIRFCGTDGC